MKRSLFIIITLYCYIMAQWIGFDCPLSRLLRGYMDKEDCQIHQGCVTPIVNYDLQTFKIKSPSANVVALLIVTEYCFKPVLLSYKKKIPYVFAPSISISRGVRIHLFNCVWRN